jgi:predicted Rossmann-fold nucleotide-binding protein
VSDASIALHGSIGTAAELLVAWNLAYVARFTGTAPHPVVAVGPRWRHLVSTLATLLETDGDLVTCVDDVAAAVATVVHRLRHG